MWATYPKLKSTSIPAHPKIPEHWDVRRVATAFETIGSGTTPNTRTDDYYDGDIPWITTAELRETIVSNTQKHVSDRALAEHSALKLYSPGSVAIAMYGATIGRLGILGVPATVNQACCVFDKSSVLNNKFFYYWLWSYRPTLISLSSGGGQPNLSQNDLRSLRIPVPTIREQESIVTFLDLETGRIDALLDKKRRLLDLLEEKRLAIITHAVIKGLDPNAPMKDSGQPTIESTPENWDVLPLRRILDCGSGDFLDNRNFELEPSEDCRIPVVGGNGILGFTYEENSPAGTLVIGRVGAHCGNIHLVDQPCWVTDNALRVVWRKQVYPPFMKHLLDTIGLNRIANRNAQPLVTGSMIKSQIVPLPPREIQIAITSHIDSAESQINLLSRPEERAINLLQEYRSALITNAVTGKIDVRGLAHKEVTA